MAVESNSQVSAVSLGIGILYIILVFFVLCLLALVAKFDGMFPTKFYNLGCCDGLMGRCVKCFQRFIIIIHYITAILILTLWILIGSGQCEAGMSNTTKIVSKKILDDVKTGNIVNTVVWIVLHFGGFFIRGCLYYEPFMYDPDPSEGAQFVTYCFKKCGP